jgi:hypothetical protein
MSQLMELGLAPGMIIAVIFFIIDLFDLLEPTGQSDLELQQTSRMGNNLKLTIA